MHDLLPFQGNQKFYMIVADNAPATQASAFTEVVRNAGLAYWHWMPNVWIIVDPTVASTALAWRLKAERYMPMTYLIVTQFQPAQDWSMRSPDAGVQWLVDTFNAGKTI